MKSALKQLTRDDLLGAVARELGVGDGSSSEFSIELTAAVLRRAAASNCPCSKETIIDIATGSLHGLDESDSIKARIREVLDSLLVIGDLLEMSSTSSLTGAEADSHLYCAPPTFVIQDDSILILGVEAEDQAAMPLSLRPSMRIRRELRFIPEAGEAIAQQLSRAGYLEIQKVAWMRLPPQRTVVQFKDDVVRRLRESGGRGALEGLTVLGPSRGSTKFSARWSSPGALTGYFVGRRPQTFGSPIWIFAELDQGRPARYIDLPWVGSRFRGCDLGWRIQSALDASSGTPQSYRVVSVSKQLDRYEFFSPLPLWVERRLRIHGVKVNAAGALIAYELPSDLGHGIDDLVQSRMWFTKSD